MVQPEPESVEGCSNAPQLTDLGLPDTYDASEALWHTELSFDRSVAFPSSVPLAEDVSSYFSGGLFYQSQSGPALTSTISDLHTSIPSGSRRSSPRKTIQRSPILKATEEFLTTCLSQSAMDYLIGLFFTRCMIMMKFVPPSQFLSDEVSGCPNRQPSSLLLAIIAASLRYATRTDVLSVCFDKDGNNIPAGLAKKLLETELPNADITTVQAMLTISEVETSSSNMMSGYMYSSMAARLLLNLGLEYSSRIDPALSDEDALARYWLLWNLSVQDHYCKRSRDKRAIT